MLVLVHNTHKSVDVHNLIFPANRATVKLSIFSVNKKNQYPGSLVCGRTTQIKHIHENPDANNKNHQLLQQDIMTTQSFSNASTTALAVDAALAGF
jgi:hypothetical protein